jgi:hybrid cluster-associated redox disulfide protein
MITKEMTLEEIIRRHPETIAVFRKFRLDCQECQMAAYKSVDHCAEFHDLDIDLLLAELNRAASGS